MDSSEDKWAKFHEKALPYEQAIAQEPFKTLIQTIVDFVKQYKIDVLFESGFGTGYLMIRFAEIFRNIPILGTDSSPGCLKRFEKLATEKNVLMPQQGEKGMSGAGTLTKAHPDIFDSKLYEHHGMVIAHGERLLIYHQGLLEHFSDEKIQELLKLQTENSFAVVFSIPSKFYGKQDFGDERLLTLEEWEKILKPFEIYQLRYYDDNKHILGILKGGFYGESEGA